MSSPLHSSSRRALRVPLLILTLLAGFSASPWPWPGPASADAGTLIGGSSSPRRKGDPDGPETSPTGGSAPPTASRGTVASASAASRPTWWLRFLDRWFPVRTTRAD